MDDQEPTDKLLDKVVARIQDSEVPDYPGPPIISDLSVLQPHAPRRRRWLAALVGTACCLVVVIAVLMRREPESDLTHMADWPGMDNSLDVAANPIRTFKIDPARTLDGMLRELDRVSERLDQIEIEVSRRQVQSEIAELLAKYRPRQIDIR